MNPSMAVSRPPTPTGIPRSLAAPRRRARRPMHPPHGLPQTPLRVSTLAHKFPRRASLAPTLPSAGPASDRAATAARQWRLLVARRHTLQLVQQTPPVIGQHLAVLDALLRPVLVPARDVVLRRLEVHQLITEALLDEDGPVVLCDDGFLVLSQTSIPRSQRRPGKSKDIP